MSEPSLYVNHFGNLLQFYDPQLLETPKGSRQTDRFALVACMRKVLTS